jgi:sugar/nucleoside kinase (ribokinase family)
VVAPPGLDRAFLHNPGANATFCSTDIDFAQVSDAALFHLGYPPLLDALFASDGDELVAIYHMARGCGATTSLDMSLPDPDSPSGQADWNTILGKALPHVDLFLPSIEEVLYACERDAFMAKRAEAAETGTSIIDLLTPCDYTRLSSRLLEYGAGIVVLKAGHRGVYVRTAGPDRLSRFGRAKPGDIGNWADRELWEPPFAVTHVASATGAGDCAIAGFLAAFLHGDTVETALKLAAAAGARNVMVHDAISGTRPYTEMAALIPGMPKAELALDDEGWRYDEHAQVWHGPAD